MERHLEYFKKRFGNKLSRRTMVGRAGSALAATFLLHPASRVHAADMTPTADGLPPGIAFTSLLVGGIVWDMPSGPVEVRLTRFTAEPGSTLPAESFPYPALMYIESGTSACPGAAGRAVYNADGTIREVSTTDGIQYSPPGATQYIPANIADGGGNEGSDLMSSIVIEFVPVGPEVTPPPGLAVG